MRHLLLCLLAVATSVLMADAAISDNDAPPVFNEDGSISDPNDHNPEEVVKFLRDYIQNNYVSRSVPSPLDAPYYMNLINNGADSPRWIPLYYNETEGCYMCDIPVLGCEWKIYSKEYFETTSSDRNQYIWGTSEQNAPQGAGGSAYYMDEVRKMAHPGANCNVQVPQGSTNQNRVYYNCTLKFWPDHSGSNWNGEFLMTGTQAGGEPTLAISGVGTAISSFAGNVDFTIKATGVYEADKQTYTVSMRYTDRYGEVQSMTADVTGLTGTFKNVAVLKGGATTQCRLTASGSQLPVYNNNGQYTGTKQDISTATPGYADITTMAQPYIIGSISGIEWSPTKLLTEVDDPKHPGFTHSIGAGTPLCEVSENAPNAYTTLVWENVQFISVGTNSSMTDVLRYRFITVLPTSTSDTNPWASVNSGVQYFPKPGQVFAPNTVACVTSSTDKDGAGTQEAYNMVSRMRNSDGDYEYVQEWYDASAEVVTSGVNTAWRPDNREEETGAYILPGAHPGHSGEVLAYYVYLDMANGTDGGPRQAVYWNYTADPTDVDDISVDARTSTSDYVDVYNMQGVCVRHGVSADNALEGLPQGIYIYGGHKYMVR